MSYLLEIVAVVLSLGLFLFIINNAIQTRNLSKRALINSLVCLFFTLLFTGAYFLDFYVIRRTYQPYIYYIFIFTSVFYLLVLPITMFIKGGKRKLYLGKHKFNQYDAKQINYVYVVYKYENKVYLKDSSGIIKKVSSKTSEEEVLREINLELGVEISPFGIKKYGSAIKRKDKKKSEYYSCYLISIDKPLNISSYKEIDKYELVDEELDYFNKQVIFHLMLEEDFSIFI